MSFQSGGSYAERSGTGRLVSHAAFILAFLAAGAGVPAPTRAETPALAPAAAPSAGQPASTVPNSEAFPGRNGTFGGFDRYDFKVDGKKTVVVTPHQAAAGRPWIWRYEIDLRSNPITGQMALIDYALLARGYTVVAMDLGNTFGCPDALKHWDVLYKEMTDHYGLAHRMVMSGLARQGLAIQRWAAANPDKVSAFFLSHGVCDIKSWPGGKLHGFGRGTGGAPHEWDQMKADYHFASDAEAIAWKQNPVDLVKPLVEGHVAAFYLIGDGDPSIPHEENEDVMVREMQAMGGDVTAIHQPTIGHHPHALADPTPIVDWLLKHSN